MRIVIDLQGIQSASKYRGIGRYTYSLICKMLPLLKDQDVWVMLNENFLDALQQTREDLEKFLPKEKIVTCKTPIPVSRSHKENIDRADVSDMIREQFISLLSPDLLFLTTLFEGYNDNSVTSIKKLTQELKTVVILYDLIPLVNEKEYLQNELYKDFYYKKLESLKKADGYLAISDYSKKEAIDVLNLESSKILNISTAVEDEFLPVTMPRNDVVNFLNHYKIKQKFVLYVPGGFDHRKNCQRLIKAYSNLTGSTRANHQLVIASKITDKIKENLLKIAKEAGLAEDEFRLLGYVPDADLKTLYSLCTLFVFPSTHEGFGLPVLEAMYCGAAVIGSNRTSIPEVIGNEDALFDPYSLSDMTQKMQEALNSPEFLTQLKIRSNEQKNRFSWENSAQKAVSFLLDFEGKTKKIEPVTVETLISHIKKQGYLLTKEDNIQIANAIAKNNQILAKPQLFVDISELVRVDAKSGIQRVVRSILSQWLKMKLEDYSIKPVYFDGKVFRYANKFIKKNFDISCEDEDYPIDFTKHDTYIALDLNAHLMKDAKAVLKHFKSIGMRINFVVYDILLLQNPNWWPKGTAEIFEAWVRDIVSLADALICISQSVADELEDWIAYNIKETDNIPHITSFHLGSDIQNSLPSKGLPDEAEEVLKTLASKPTFLSVGTIEPRKGYGQLLEAFELLWAEGCDVNLVIVGKQGWMTETLCQNIKNHTMLQTKLFWLEAISDEYLEAVYEASSCLIAPSEAEGFGLPLIEAARKSLPVIARDIPVFREVAKEHAFYFQNSNNPLVIANVVKEWIQLDGNYPDSSDMKYLTWEESAKKLLQKTLG